MKRLGIFLGLMSALLTSCSEVSVQPPPPENPVAVRPARSRTRVLPKPPENTIFSSPEFSLDAISKDWTLLSDEQGIQTYRKATDSSEIVSFRGESVIQAPLIKVAAILNDDELRKQWVDSLVEAKTVERISKTEQIEYNHTKVPFPFHDRDFVFRSQIHISHNPLKVLITLRSISDPRIPIKDGIVRGEIVRSFYYLKEIDGGKATKVVMEMTLDPRGTIPQWLTHWVQKDWPKKTFNNLRKLAQRDDIRPGDEIRSFLK